MIFPNTCIVYRKNTYSIFSVKTLVIIIFCFSQLITRAQGVLILQPDSACGKDAILHGLFSERSVNYGDNPQFIISSWTFMGTPGDVRNVVEFDLSSIPAGATVDSAFLSLYAWPYSTGSGTHSTLSGSNEAWIRRVITPWNEHTVTWYTQPSVTTVNQFSMHASTSPTENYPHMDVTALVQDMVNNPATSFGFLMQLKTEAFYRRLNFCSSDFPTPSMRPKLEVYYAGTPHTGHPDLLGADTAMCFENDSSIVLNAYITGGHYLWQNGSTLSSFTVHGPGDYWVQVSDCSQTYRDTIHVSDRTCEVLPPVEPVPVAFMLPNIFTPNNDKENDLLVPVKSSGILSMHTEIYNRWGQNVFNTDDLSIRWDGNINGKKASDGTYYWIVSYTDIYNKTATVKGHITLLR